MQASPPRGDIRPSVAGAGDGGGDGPTRRGRARPNRRRNCPARAAPVAYTELPHVRDADAARDPFGRLETEHRRSLMDGLVHRRRVCPGRMSDRARLPFVPVGGHPARLDPSSRGAERASPRPLLAACRLDADGTGRQQAARPAVAAHAAAARRGATQGWYADRRHYQFAFVVAIAAVGVLGVGAMAWVLRRVLGRVWIAVLGLGWMTSFVDHPRRVVPSFDTFLRTVTSGGNTALELSGIAMVAAGAGRAIRERPVERQRRPADQPGLGVPITPSDASGSDGMP